MEAKAEQREAGRCGGTVGGRTSGIRGCVHAEQTKLSQMQAERIDEGYQWVEVQRL